MKRLRSRAGPRRRSALVRHAIRTTAGASVGLRELVRQQEGKHTGGTPCGRVDEAGAVARGTKTCQGMNEGHMEDETGTRISLRTLRDRAVASGALSPPL
jgi:hypothetical protein